MPVKSEVLVNPFAVELTVGMTDEEPARHVVKVGKFNVTREGQVSEGHVLRVETYRVDKPDRIEYLWIIGRGLPPPWVRPDRFPTYVEQARVEAQMYMQRHRVHPAPGADSLWELAMKKAGIPLPSDE